MIKLQILQFNGMGSILETEHPYYVYLPKGLDNATFAEDFRACDRMITRVILSCGKIINVDRKIWLTTLSEVKRGIY